MGQLSVNEPLPEWSPASGQERDPERIDVLIEQLRAVWKEHPALRLGQLLVCLCDPQPNTLFNVEDHLVSAKILEYRETGIWPTAQLLDPE